MTDKKEIIKENEIDLVELTKIFWSKKWFIIRVSAVFMSLGLIIAFTTPKEYSASCILIPEAMDGGAGFGGSLGGLAALAGVDLGGSSGAGATINPALYRSIAQSTPFLLKLMNQEFYFEEIEIETSLYNYYLKYRRKSLFSKLASVPFYALSWLKGNEEVKVKNPKSGQILSLTNSQEKVAGILAKQILVTMDWDLKIVTIEADMQDAKVAAEVTFFIQKYITNYVENYSTAKSMKQLEFVETQYKDRKKEFERVQSELANFRDQNKFVTTAKAKSEEERIQSRYNLSFGVYSQLAQQVEKIKLQINDEKPIFTVLEPVKIPATRSKPNRGIIVFISGLCGILAGAGKIFFNLLKNRF